jgi:3-hydroxybutyryl-CoA dehydrogenase
MEIKKVGVVGCGLMGSGIAQVCAQSGLQTVVSEINDDLLNKGMGMIKTNLSKSVEKGKLAAAEKDAILGRMKATTNMADFTGCDLVIEVVVENMQVKKKIFADLEKICPPHAILASNTSCLSVMDMAMATKKPDKVLGMHFFNPVPVMKLLELVQTIATSEETMKTIRAFGKTIDKTVIVAKDSPGFVVNRLLVPYLFDAMRMLESGQATREDIDQGMQLGCNHPMGALTLSDFVGLDTLYFIANAMYDDYKEPRFAPPMLLKKMVAAGRLGRKSGRGFYEYK